MEALWLVLAGGLALGGMLVVFLAIRAWIRGIKLLIKLALWAVALAMLAGAVGATALWWQQGHPVPRMHAR